MSSTFFWPLAAASALSKLTWILAIAFIITSIIMTIIAAQNAAGSSVLDRLGVDSSAEESAPVTPDAEDLLPPGQDATDITPPASDITPPPAN